MILRLLPIAIAALAVSGARPHGAAFQQAGASRTALVTLSDARNRFIVDIGPDDFVITEGGKAREILDARVADYPIAVLVDTGRSARPVFADIRKAVGRFVNRLGQRPIIVGTLGDPPSIVTSFDDDRGVVAERVEALEANPAAESMILQAAANAARKLRETQSLFTAIVIVSATPVDDSRNAADELVVPIVDAHAIVHAVVNRVAPTAPIVGLMEVLRRLSQETHGQFTSIYSAASYQAALDSLADRLASEIMVEYLVPVGSAAADAQVGVRLPGARVRGLGVR